MIPRRPHDPWPVRLLGRLVAPRWREDVLGDLVEECARTSVRNGSIRLAGAIVRAAAASRWQAYSNSRATLSDMPGAPTPVSSRSTGMLETLSQDLDTARASLGRSPGFVAAAVATLGVGTGAVLSIMTLISAVHLAPLPYADSDRLMHVQGGADGRYAVTMPVHELAVAPAGAVEASAVWQGWQTIVGHPEGGIQRRSGASVSRTWFDVLGTRASAGRLFLPEDGVPGHAPVVVISHAFWQEFFGARADAVGATLVLDGATYTVVGVADESFLDPVSAHVFGASQAPAFWRPDPPLFREAADRPGWTAFWSVVRVRPGTAPERLRADVVRTLAAVYPDWQDHGEWLHVRTFREVATGHLTTTFVALFAAAFLVLLIACANVANLLLARAVVRSREMAVRASLGAARGRLVRQLLTENLVLAGAAVVLGLALAAIAIPVLSDLLRDALRPGQVPSLDWRVAAFASLLVVATTLLSGLVPALRTSEVRLSEVLRAPRGADQGGAGVRSTLVAAEVALGVIVLVSAALLGRTLWNLWATDAGFDADATVVAYASLPAEFITTPEDQNLTVEALERELAGVPGVAASGIITDLPMSGAVNSTGILRPGGPAGEEPARDQVLVRAVTPGYFGAMGVPVLRGRAFTPADRANAPAVALVNRSYADLLPGGGIGRIVIVRSVPREIVGVVDDVVEFRLADGTGDRVLYTPYAQEEQTWMRTGFHIVLRTGLAPAALDAPVRAAAQRANPSILMSQRLQPMREYLASDLASHRFRALLIGLFGATSLLLAAAGIAALTAYSVARRIPEIGIRMALGASTRDVVAGVLAHSGTPVLAGLAAGLIGAFAAGRALAHFLFGVRPLDPLAYLAAAFVMAAVALLAAWLPARRAATIDPADALRSSG
jgi:putative ABC transport system permease protein